MNVSRRTFLKTTSVSGHDDYPKPEKGCIPDVVGNWQ